MARIDRELVEQARDTDMLEFLAKNSGFTFTFRNGAYRCKQHPSLVIKEDCRSWYWHSQGVGGFGAIDYLVKVENMSFREAVAIVVPYVPHDWRDGIVEIDAADVQRKAEPPQKELILPEKSGLTLRLYDYLCNKRGIDSEIVHYLLDCNQLYEDRRGNVVFIGFDEDRLPRFASLRGTHGDCSFRGDCKGSDKRYAFALTPAMAFPTLKLYIFESPIDAMSHATLANIENGRNNAWHFSYHLSLAGTSDTSIPFFLKAHGQRTFKELIFCLDNDPAGLEAAASLTTKYANMGYTTRLELPKGKDFNEDLMAYRQSQRKKERSRDVAR